MDNLQFLFLPIMNLKSDKKSSIRRAQILLLKNWRWIKFKLLCGKHYLFFFLCLFLRSSIGGIWEYSAFFLEIWYTSIFWSLACMFVCDFVESISEFFFSPFLFFFVFGGGAWPLPPDALPSIFQYLLLLLSFSLSTEWSKMKNLNCFEWLGSCRSVL